MNTNIEVLAREAASGMLSYDAEGSWRLGEKEVERFATLVRTAALEEAAISGVHGTGNPKHCWDFLVASSRTYATSQETKP